MEHCNGLQIPTKVEEPLGTYANGSEDKIDCTKSYDSVIGMMFYLQSNTRPDISFAVHQCARFTHNTKASHETAVKRICRYLRGTKDNDLVFNPSKKLVVDFMLIQILRDCGYMKIFKTLFLIGVELDLW